MARQWATTEDELVETSYDEDDTCMRRPHTDRLYPIAVPPRTKGNWRLAGCVAYGSRVLFFWESDK
jgi:hypothetical protein